MAARIEDYALIGDCETAALLSRDGSIDWLCWPRFDSSACFAAILGEPKNGRWLLAARDANARIMRRYIDRTLIVETQIETDTGAATVLDFMPIRGKNSDIVRIVKGERGRVAMHTELVIRFDYGSVLPWMTRIENRATLCGIAGPDMVTLRTPVDLRGEDMKTVGDFEVGPGDVVPFVLTYSSSFAAPPDPVDPREALHETQSFWHEWCDQFRGAGEWDEPVLRSLITLKALTYAPSGGIVAAPTSSLPEQIGGPRNWDYRYCWLRDATFTLLALMNGGFYGEAKAWHNWLLRAVAGTPKQVQIMYGLAGERRLEEWEVPWLTGYENSKPVRIGNAAAQQVQIDIYGEVMDALCQSHDGKLDGSPDVWNLQRELMKHLETIWNKPDEGIWEVRGGPQQFVYSKVMAWVAFDRAVKSVENYGLKGPVDHWREIRARIHEEVCQYGYNEKVGAFVQHYGTTELDASCLLIALVGFLPPDDPRIRSTVKTIQRELTRDGLVLRYRTSAGKDGLPPGEGAFLACSFWLADCLVMIGEQDEARKMFERLLALRNDLGLLAEEYDPHTKRQVGNFPQAFSHVALVNTAYNLAKQDKPAEQRSGAKRPETNSALMVDWKIAPSHGD